MENIMTARAPAELQKLLSAQAKNLGMTRNTLVLQILWDWADNKI